MLEWLIIFVNSYLMKNFELNFNFVPPRLFDVLSLVSFGVVYEMLVLSYFNGHLDRNWNREVFENTEFIAGMNILTLPENWTQP